MTARSRIIGILMCAVVLTGAAARVAPLFHDFWLDEAWSYLMVRDLVLTPIDIIRTLRSDNNHPLNSLSLYVLGTTVDWPVYRLPAWISGVLCIPMSFVVMRRFGEPHALYTMALVACSYPLIVYSTEARGYGMMLFLLLVAIESVQRWLAIRRWVACGSFWIAVILGFLAHLTFIHGYLAILVFSVRELRRQNSKTIDLLADILAIHGIPMLFLAALYWGFIRHVAVGGAAPTRLILSLIEAITMALGGPTNGPLVMLYVVGFFILLLLGLHRLKVRSEGWHVLFACGIVLVPLPLVTIRLFLHPHTTPIFPRYFLTSIALFLLLTGFLLGEFQLRGRREKLLSGALLILILMGNLMHSTRFTLIGRGQYWKALQYMARKNPDQPIHVSSNSEFRTSLILSFYARYLPKEGQIVYHARQDKERSQNVDWWIVEFLETDQSAPQELATEMGNFSFEKYFDFYGPSGCGWAVYRRSHRAG